MSSRLEDLRTEIRRDQIRRLFRGTKYRRLRMKIEPYLMAGRKTAQFVWLGN